MNYSELLEIFKLSLILTNQVFNFLNKTYEKLDDKNKLRHHILYRMKSTSTTIFRILNQNINNPNLVDFSSIAILTRSIIECYKTFYYLTSADINESEFQFRFLMFEIHDILERQEMIRRLKATDLKQVGEQTDLKELGEQLDELKNKIHKNEYYKQIELQNEKYKNLLKDGKCKDLFSEDFDKAVSKANGCFINHYDVLLSRLVKINPVCEQNKEKINKRYSFLYKYLSNFVHISPYSISQPSNPIAIDDLEKIILTITFYLNIANEDILDEFPELEEEIQVQTNYPDIFKGLEKFIQFLKCEIN
ncbi:DUF5677 domain-containing protein [Nostoc sp. ChiSLP03a]|uniref:DUF5677 domain-containing protein n=1 Tax=Nostoc sp. ChiSLP03a TaxID=3075380 RepID=UPI002AD4E0AE|nr:DUF5677 domain-containing protein [Nostoc sp. ChiSLP03a]MDZ8210632.1 DUF5677 domain-containing protein [Nostoc sp. ChiSLP03a]